MKNLQLINTNFLKEWEPYEQLEKKVKRAIVSHFINNKYQYEQTHNKSEAKLFIVYSFTQIDNILGLAYTSTGDFAALWVCNGGYLMLDNSFYFIGFAINELGQVVGICQDSNENEKFILM